MSINLQESLAAGKERRAAKRQAAAEEAAKQEAVVKQAFYEACPELFDPANPPTIEVYAPGVWYVGIDRADLGLAPFYLVWSRNPIGVDWTDAVNGHWTRDPVSIADLLAERSEAYEASITEVPF